MFGDNQRKWRELQQRSDFQGVLRCGGHVGIIVTFAFIQYTLALRGHALLSSLFLVAQAFPMAFLFTAFHEMTHRTPFASNVLSDGIGHIFGFLIFRPLRHYTYYHYNHHKFTGDPKRDPELQDSFIDLKLDNPVSYLCYLSGIPFWIDRLTTLLRHGVLNWVVPREEAFVTEVTRPMMLSEARLYCALYAALLVASLTKPQQVGFPLWRLWILPTLIAQPFLRFYLVAEHTGCEQGTNMLSNTRTTKTFRWYRWLAWEMPFHAEHHAFPFVPFYKLPALHEHLCSNETDPYRRCNPNGENGYLGVHIGLIKKFVGAAC